ncbi:AAA family ATPase [uncultured Veillonella sp.]|uniref:AAA family ATPase n=1 Tax=uncultured Veillonella sp. TaxID=159268 RepID=UPI00260BADD8|nr:AAA family ATPase [uncultured Veillonella sp.]
MGRIISIMSGKGGVGKTTLTASLGAALSRAGHKVLITDADFGMRDLDLVVGKENDIFFDAIDICQENCTSDYAILPLGTDFDFLPATQSRRWEDVGRKGYAKLIKRLAKRYDYVIIDAPAGIGRGNEAIFRAADQIVLVAEPIWVSMRAVQRVMQMCREVRQLNYMIVLNNVGQSKAQVSLDDALGALQVERLGTILPYRESIQTWSQEGLLHEEIDPFFDHMMKALVKSIVSDEYMEEPELVALWQRMKDTYMDSSNVGHDIEYLEKESNDVLEVVPGESEVETTEESVENTVEKSVEETAGQFVENTVGQSVEEPVEQSVEETVEDPVKETVGKADGESIENADGAASVSISEHRANDTDTIAAHEAEGVSPESPTETVLPKKKGGLASLLRRQLTSLWSRRGRMR